MKQRIKHFYCKPKNFTKNSEHFTRMGNVSTHAVTMVDQTREWFMGSNLDSQSNSEIAVARATIIGRIWVLKRYRLIPCSCPLKMNKYNKYHSMYVLYSKAVVHLLTGHALHGRSDKIEDKDGYTRSRDKSSSLHTSHHKVSPGISSMVMVIFPIEIVDDIT